QRACHRLEELRQIRVRSLRSQLLGPVQRQVEVAAAVVDLARLAGGRLVLVQERGRGGAESVGQDLRASVAGGGGQVLEALRQGEELAEAVPAQVVLRKQLLH